MAKLKKTRIEANLDSKFTIESHIRNHVAYVDQPAPSGADKGLTPLEYLFMALAGCLGTIARIIANQRKLSLRGINFVIEGELDPMVLMGKSDENRAGFQGLTITATIDADMTQEEKESFLHELDCRCPVSDNILNATPMRFIAR